MIVLALMAAIAFSLFWMGVYVYALYTVGRGLARRFRLRFRPAIMALAFSLFAGAVAFPALHIDLDPISRATLAFAIWLIHAQPLSVGYWATTELQRQRDLDRWEQTVDEWVNEFETAPPSWLHELDKPEP